LHVVQLNLLRAPEEVAPADLLDRWHSLPDIAEVAAGAGVEVSVIQAASCDARVERNGIVYRFLALDGSDGRARLAAEVARLGVDLIHVHGLAYARLAHALAARLPALPILLQDHANRPPPWWRRAVWRRWYTAASAVSFTSLAQARPFVDAGLFAPATQLFAIPESSCRFTPGDRAAARAETGLHGSPCVLWIGHLDANKDPLSVLDGVAAAAARLPGLRLWCAYGTAPLLEAVRARIAQDPALAARVHLLGRVPHAQVQTLLRAADLFVSGSRAESCGYAALEAMACGVPPVLTDIPAFRALTGDGRIGRLWSPGDAAQLADALVAMAEHGPTPAQVRAHFDAELSFGALGRRWARAYGMMLAVRWSAA
jgi:glycosyltransferase involved in cell wall biosynthesis